MRYAIVFPGEIIETFAGKSSKGLKLLFRIYMRRADADRKLFCLASGEVGLENDHIRFVIRVVIVIHCLTDNLLSRGVLHVNPFKIRSQWPEILAGKFDGLTAAR